MRLRDTHKSVICASNEQKPQIAGDVTDKAVVMAMFFRCLRHYADFKRLNFIFKSDEKMYGI